MKLVEGKQFDTIYHEHYSYLSLSSVNTIFNVAGLSIFDVEELHTHGGSLRVFAQRTDTGKSSTSDNVSKILNIEKSKGIESQAFYEGFQQSADKIKVNFLSFLEKARADNKKVAAYGAAAKGNTLLNFAGVKAEQIDFVVDRSPLKKDRYLPGSHIPIVDESVLKEEKPDYIIILPWNITDEVSTQLEYSRAWGAKFVTAIPELSVF